MAEIASAFVTIAPSARGFGSSLNSQVSGETKTAGQSIGKAFGKMFVLGASVLAAAGVGNLLKGSIDEAREAQKVSAATEQIIKSTGGTANLTAEQIGNLSGALSSQIGVDDELIQSGANVLLTFKNVADQAGEGADIFTRATKAGADLAATGFGSIESNAKTLGKALNDPVKGMAALTRTGVTFTDGQQDQIKAMVEAGDLLGAQKLLLKEVESQVGGVAAATATDGEKAQVALGNLKETIGTALLPVVDRLAVIFTTKIAPAISGFVTGMQSGTGAGGAFVGILTEIGSALLTVGGFLLAYKAPIAAFVAVLATWAAVTKVLAVVNGVLNAVLLANPVTLIVVAVALLIAAIVLVATKTQFFQKVWGKVWGAIGGPVKAAVGFIKNNWQKILAILTGPIGLAVLLIVKHWDKIKAGALAVVGFIKDRFAAVKDALAGPVQRARQLIGTAIAGVKTAIQSIKTKVDDVGGLIKAGLKAAFAPFDAVLSVIQAVINKIQDLIDKIKSIPKPDIPFVRAAGGVATSSAPSIAAAPLPFTHAPLGDLGRPKGAESELRAIRNELVELRKVTGRQGHEFGREINGAGRRGLVRA